MENSNELDNGSKPSELSKDKEPNRNIDASKNFWIVFLTALLTFLITSASFLGMKTIDSGYSISFDKNTISSNTINKFNDAKKKLKDGYYKEVSYDKLLEGAISGMADSLDDPYTVYYTKEQMKSFDEKSQGSYCGIGVSVKPDEHGILTVVNAFADSPAKASGLLSGDKIVKVDGKDVTVIKDEDTVINMIKGPENTSVKITIYRNSDEGYHDFDITRKSIKVINLKSEVLPDKIGYIKLNMFDNEISTNFQTHLKQLQDSDIKGLIIDVRDNPGGNYREVVKICDTLLPKDLIVYTKGRSGKKEEELSDDACLNLPITLLINQNSASASEILAGALKDNKKATLVGTKSYGKGVVQTVHRFKDGSGMKYTVSQYFTPSNVCIDKIGIQPDITINLGDKFKNLPISELKREDDIQLNKAIEVIKTQIK